MNVSMIDNRLRTGDSCSCWPCQHDGCGSLALGLYLGLLMAPQRPIETVVRTGPLVVDRWRREALLYGERLPLTDREWEILDYLAGHVGRTCSHDEILSAVWPDGFVTSHLLHVNVGRLRTKLGAWETLVMTDIGRGYRLVPLTPSGGHYVPLEPVGKRWAKAWDRCACCGTTALPHGGRGRCSRCKRSRRGPHIGPCAMPPSEPTP